MSRALEVAGRLANDAAEVITATAGREHHSGAAHKANPFDWVTDTDRTLERHTRRVLAAEFPGVPVVGEEYGADPDAHSSRYRWVVDPVDGTANYVAGFPWCAYSLALVDASGPVVGVIADPSRAQIYAAARGRGVRANGVPVRVVPRAPAGGLICTELGPDRTALFTRHAAAGYAGIRVARLVGARDHAGGARTRRCRGARGLPRVGRRGRRVPCDRGGRRDRRRGRAARPAAKRGDGGRGAGRARRGAGLVARDRRLTRDPDPVAPRARLARTQSPTRGTLGSAPSASRGVSARESRRECSRVGPAAVRPAACGLRVRVGHQYHRLPGRLRRPRHAVRVRGDLGVRLRGREVRRSVRRAAELPRRALRGSCRADARARGGGRSTMAAWAPGAAHRGGRNRDPGRLSRRGVGRGRRRDAGRCRRAGREPATGAHRRVRRARRASGWAGGRWPGCCSGSRASRSSSRTGSPPRACHR